MLNGPHRQPGLVVPAPTACPNHLPSGLTAPQDTAAQR